MFITIQRSIQYTYNIRVTLDKVEAYDAKRQKGHLSRRKIFLDKEKKINLEDENMKTSNVHSDRT